MSRLRKQSIRATGIIGAVLIFAISTFSETEYKPERYELILKRSPFGSEPLSDSEKLDKATAATVKALEKNFRLTFLLEREDGEIKAGFQNLKPKSGEPASSIIMVGESFMEMTLKGIDFMNSEAKMEYKGKPVSFQLTKAPEVKTPVVKKVASTPQRRFGGGFKRAEPKKEPEPQLSPAEQKQRREEIRKNLQDYQMEVLRTGMPPLPIKLTQEMDDKLVAEGVLPPAE